MSALAALRDPGQFEHRAAMKISLLLGCNGAGKQHITDRLRRPLRVIRVDEVRRDVLTPFRGLLVGDEINRWPIWDALTSSFDVVPRFARAIQDRYPNLHSGLPLIAEGGLLAHDGFRLAVLESLHQLGLPTNDTQLFWIDPDAERVLRNRQLRSDIRLADRGISLAVVQDEVAWYRSIASRLNCIRFADVVRAVEEIDAFLSG